MAILNSKVTSFFIAQTSSKFSGGFFAYNRQYIQNIPIDLTNKKLIDTITANVNIILDLNYRYSRLQDKQTDEKARLEKEIQKLDSEIDEEIYKLYGITDEEKKVIEDSLK